MPQLGGVLIRIRYSSELRPGLNGHAECQGRTTVIYLLPGLQPAQRAAVLRRLRQHGRMGIGPRLPVTQLLPALLADRIKMVVGQAGAILRTHPAGSTLPVMAMSVAVAGFLLLSAVSIRIVQVPLAGGVPPVLREPPPTASGSSGPGPGSGGPGRGDRSQPGQSGAPPRPGRSAGAGRGQGGTVPGAGATPPGSGTTLSSSAASSAPPGAASSNVPAPASSPAALDPAGAPSTSTQVCLNLGPFGVCLGL